MTNELALTIYVGVALLFWWVLACVAFYQEKEPSERIVLLAQALAASLVWPAVLIIGSLLGPPYLTYRTVRAIQESRKRH